MAGETGASSPTTASHPRGVHRLLAAVALLALLATGCGDLDIEVTAFDDGSAVLITSATFDRAVATQLIGGDVTADDLLALAGIDPQQLPEDASLTPVETAEAVGTRVTVTTKASPDPAAALDAALTRLGDGVNPITGPGGPFQAFDLRQDDGGYWTFEAVTAASDEPDGLSAFLLAGGSFTFRLTLPGEVIHHDADRVEPDSAGEPVTLVWDLPLAGASRSLSATSAPSVSEGDEDWLLIAGLALAAIALVAVGVALIWRARR